MNLFIVAVVVTLLWFSGVTENIFISVWLRLYENVCRSYAHLGWI